MAAEIAAHSREIYAMDLHPEQDYFVSAGKDSILNVFSLPVFDGGKGQCDVSSSISLSVY
jgi:hypothetical protein